MLAAAFSQARDDAQARTDGKPLWEALGGGSHVSASAAIGVGEDGQPDFSQIESAAAGEYRHAKLKITPRTDAGLIAAAVNTFSDMSFGVDANGTLGVDDMTLLRSLDELGLSYIEQPGDRQDLEFHATLRQTSHTLVGLDESATSEAAIRTIIDSKAADLINLKVGRFGPTATLRLAKQIAAAGLAVRIGGLLESGIGRAHSVSLASHQLFSVTGDIAGSDRYFTDDLVRPQWRVTDGLLSLPPGPGIGVEVHESAVAGHAIDALRIG
jgi:O-succinylbenzoate synthase